MSSACQVMLLNPPGRCFQGLSGTESQMTLSEFEALDACYSDSATPAPTAPALIDSFIEEIPGFGGFEIIRINQGNVASLSEELMKDVQAKIADFKAQVDSAVNNFLLQDKAKITATLESALSSAASPELLRKLLEKAVSDNLAGNQGLMEELVTASFRNGNSVEELRSTMVAALAGTGSISADAVRQLVGFATGPGASLTTQKELLVALEAEAVKKNRDVLSTARAWQTVFGTREDVIEGTIATLIGASTGATGEDSKTVAAAAFSSAALKAGGVLLSGYANPDPLRTAFLTAQSDARIAAEMKRSVTDIYGGDVTKVKDTKRFSANKGELAVLLDKVYSTQSGLSGKVRDARKNVFEAMATVDDARNIAGTAAQNARSEGAAAARKAFSGSGKY